MKDARQVTERGGFISLPTLTHITRFVPFKQGRIYCSFVQKYYNSNGQTPVQRHEQLSSLQSSFKKEHSSFENTLLLPSLSRQ